MKYLILPLILFITACANTSNEPVQADLTGRLLGSFVSTQSGLIKGHILHLSEQSEISKVSSVASGNSRKVLLLHPDPKSLGQYAGKTVSVSGELLANHVDIFHTDFEMKVTSVSLVE